MKITISYGVKILGNDNQFLNTIKAFRDAVPFLISVCDGEWESLDHRTGSSLWAPPASCQGMRLRELL